MVIYKGYLREEVPWKISTKYSENLSEEFLSDFSSKTHEVISDSLEEVLKDSHGIFEAIVQDFLNEWFVADLLM